MPGATPLRYWIGFHLLVLLLLAVEHIRARRSAHRKAESLLRSALQATMLWVAAAVAVGALVLHVAGISAATQYFAGYALEQSLSIDNLFVFLLLFQHFRIAPSHQPRILYWGVVGAIVLRGLFIGLGLALLERFHWVEYLFAVVLLVAAVRLLRSQQHEADDASPVWIRALERLRPISLRQDRFLVRENGRTMATVLLLALLAIELTDVIFALDSIPAVLAITRHPFVAYASNIMAVMALRSLYFLLAHLLTRLRFLHYGLAAVLGFAAFKVLTASWLAIGPLLSLGIILLLVGTTVVTSLAVPVRRDPA
ncbi:MAG: TerC/Alx family metal homeostasis membrane protein [Acidobacteriota bacterium]|nr:TerC/Alx family metal homeostasis membrane protein [Acidobacteriota bacterium]